MTRKINVDKEYRKYHGKKAIERFFRYYAALDISEWRETIEWMCEAGVTHFIDDRFADGTRNNDWTYSLWFEEDDEYTYIAIITRE